MKKQKGFISIIASLVILVIGFGIAGAAYQYSQKVKGNLEDDIVSVSNKVDKLGGSVIYQKNGGTGTSTASWNGLIRIATGTWATTTITDADVPNNITITSITSLTLNTLEVTSTSQFTGTSTFSAWPTLPSGNPYLGNQPVTKSYVDSTSTGSQILTAVAQNLVADASLFYMSFNNSYSSSTGNNSSSNFWRNYYIGKYGTIRNMWVFMNFPLSLPTAHCTTTKNGADTTLGISFSYSQSTGTDAVNSFSVVPGDYIAARCQGTGATSTAPGGYITVEFK